LVTHASGQKRIIEVKTVVDTDYCAAFPPPTTTAKATKTSAKGSKIKCLFTSDQMPYRRTAIFPWGNSNQKGPDGEKVVSTRAIHHVRELTRIASGELVGDAENGAERYKATILFVVIRGDAESFRPNVQACPSFGRYLRLAANAGVEILVKRVSWGTGEQEGMCFDDKLLPIEWPGGF
jgi:DNA-binding sugar fermentation-stimulating protein